MRWITGSRTTSVSVMHRVTSLFPAMVYTDSGEPSRPSTPSDYCTCNWYSGSWPHHRLAVEELAEPLPPPIGWLQLQSYMLKASEIPWNYPTSDWWVFSRTCQSATDSALQSSGLEIWRIWKLFGHFIAIVVCSFFLHLIEFQLSNDAITTGIWHLCMSSSGSYAFPACKNHWEHTIQWQEFTELVVLYNGIYRLMGTSLAVGNRTMHVHTSGGWQHNGVIIPDWGNIVCDQDLVTMYHIIISNNVTPELVWKIIWLSCFCILTSPHGRLYQFTIHLLLSIFTYVVLNMYS
jgi:hypothetical protein